MTKIVLPLEIEVQLYKAVRAQTQAYSALSREPSAENMQKMESTSADVLDAIGEIFEPRKESILIEACNVQD